MQNVAPEPTKVWLVGGGLPEPWTYAELGNASGRVASGSTPAGVADILLRLTNALRAGEEIDVGEVSFSGEGLPPPDIQSAVRDDYLEDWGFRPEALVTVRTSGTTGCAAAVRHRAEHLWRNVIVDSRHADAVWGLAFNPCHIAGVQVYLQALANGNTVVNLWGLAQAEVVSRCQMWGVTHLSATPTFYRLLLPLDERLPAVRSISVGGERADENLIAQLRREFPGAKVRNIYASTEAGSLFVSAGDEFEVPSRLSDRVLCDQGKLWLHRTLLGEATIPGEWYDTGDLVAITSTTPLRFRVVGRVHGWINVGGEKVNPSEIEDVLLAHPAVAAARVYGRKNSVTGQILAAELVIKKALVTEQQVREFAAVRLPPVKVPRLILFVRHLELTATGKIKS